MAHCRTCACEPKAGWHLTVFLPNEVLHGVCGTCGQVRWKVIRFDNRYRYNFESLHCACCTHGHDLPPGGHYLPEAGRAAGARLSGRRSSEMGYTRITESGRRYERVSMRECHECGTRLDDDIALEVHEAYHAMKRASTASLPKRNTED